MILSFINSKDFCDALNSYIFEYFLPHFFNEDKNFSFLGIGSIVGLDNVQNPNK
jgi:hypothetical protein